MNNSIQHFQTKVAENLEFFLEYSSDMTKIAEMVQGVTRCMVGLGVSMIAAELESCDAFLCKNKIQELFVKITVTTKNYIQNLIKSKISFGIDVIIKKYNNTKERNINIDVLKAKLYDGGIGNTEKFGIKIIP